MNSKITPFWFLMLSLAVISFWRGVWGLMDLYLFPDNQVLSYSASLLLGLIILFVTQKVDKLI